MTITSQPSMFSEWAEEGFKGDLQSRGYTIWPNFTSRLQHINSDIKHVSVRALEVKIGDNVLTKVIEDLEERKHKNFAFYAFPVDVHNYLDDDFVLRSVYLIHYASWA